jgi:hypothetical protein
MKKYDKAVIQAELDDEEEILQDLKDMYGRALTDTAKRISDLSARTDMENLQSIVYQKRYQKVLQEEIEGVLSVLHSDSYSSISDYLNKCYENGYVGTMYSLANQNIPLIIPINQAAVVNAITTESKLSKRLYDSLGEDITKLKKNVRIEVSRGVVLGKSWNDVAGQLARKFEHTDYSKAYSRASVIARTEGHRVCVRSALDAQQVAKSKGADVVKQWDAALDGRTRSTHRQLDGQIRELDEDFEVGGMKAEAPGMFGIPSQDCNCRCALVTRARWELDGDELKALQERAEYYGLDKSDEFEKFKDKYLQILDNADKIQQSNNKIKQSADTETKDELMKGLPKLSEVKTNDDIKAFAEQFIDNLGIDCTNIEINVKDALDNGHCIFGRNTTRSVIHYSEYVLKANDERSMTHRVKTAFHESFHLSAEGKGWDGLTITHDIKERWRSLEETFTESAAHYLLERYGVVEKIAPSYAKELVTNLPKLKKLDKYSSCSTIQDFGKIAFTDRQNGADAKWMELSKQKNCVKLADDYYAQYHSYISEHEDELFDMFLGNMPGFGDYKEQMKNDLKSAMSKNNLVFLNDNEQTVYYGIMSCAMQKVGVK